MSASEREQVIEQLRAMTAGWGDGLDLDTPSHWVIEDLKEPVPFFEHVPILLPPDSILYVEGNNIVPEMARLYSAHHARNAVEVARDSIVPVPDIYHFTCSPEVLARLREFAANHPVTEMFDHLKAYRDGHLLFTFHDAFEGWLRISERVPEEAVARFCEKLGVSRRHEETKGRDPEQLRSLLRAFEHPGQVRIQGESWLRAMWRRWIAR